MPGTPILTQIEEKMKTMIGSMEKGSYHFSWDQNINEVDLAKSSFPTAAIYVEDENNLDDPDGPDSNAYFQEVNFRIEVYARLEEEMSNPRWEINKALNKCLDDLKKVFGSNYNMDGVCDKIMYQGSNREYINNNDVFIPAKLITRWLVEYEQDRDNPDIIAGS